MAGIFFWELRELLQDLQNWVRNTTVFLMILTAAFPSGQNYTRILSCVILMSLINILQYFYWRLPRTPSQGQNISAAGTWYIYVIRILMLVKNSHQWIPFTTFAPTSVGLLFCLDGGGTYLQKWNLIRLRMPERKYFYFLCHGYCYYFASVLFYLREWSIKFSLVEVLPSLFWISYSTPALERLLPFL